MFTIDLKGYAKILAGKPKGRILAELIQNAWDEDSRKVEINFKKIPGQPLATIEVIDDNPEGFKDLSHAYTLFAESDKKSDPTKRGRFNKGEKDVIVICKEATIITTKGGVKFDVVKGKRTWSTKKTKEGSVFKATLRMNADEYQQTLIFFESLIVPMHSVTKTYFNGKLMKRPLSQEIFHAKLPTLRSDEIGQLRPTVRNVLVELFPVKEGDTPMLYEMGIPVVELGDDTWHVNVNQKVPLNMDRDNVTPSYLKKLRVAILNNACHYLEKEECSNTWVREAMAQKDICEEAVRKVTVERFGNRLVINSPTDQEANNKAVADGCTVITGKQMSKEEWANVKRHLDIPSATEAYGKKGYAICDEIKNPTKEMMKVQQYTKMLGEHLLGFVPYVKFAEAPGCSYAAWWDKKDSSITYNVSNLGKKWFNSITEKTDSLIIHEFGHHFESNHLSSNYYRALSDLGAKLKKLALESPKLFKDF